MSTATALFYYDPLTELGRLFDEAYTTRCSPGNPQSRAAVQKQDVAQTLKPRMDLHEDAQNNTVTATFELPGLTKENVQIDVHNRRLTISGEIRSSSEHEESGYAVRERRFGKFSRTLQLPQGVKEDQINASLENGVLTVTFPKTTPDMEPKKITIS